MVIIGVISDTHGLLRPQACEYLRDVDLIVHAGDIGAADVIPELEKIAPVKAIRGNVDKGAWADAFAQIEVIELAGHHLASSDQVFKHTIGNDLVRNAS
jgi:putative phosphoesterase